jgi:hypothetical protein
MGCIKLLVVVLLHHHRNISAIMSKTNSKSKIKYVLIYLFILDFTKNPISSTKYVSPEDWSFNE